MKRVLQKVGPAKPPTFKIVNWFTWMKTFKNQESLSCGGTVTITEVATMLLLRPTTPIWPLMGLTQTMPNLPTMMCHPPNTCTSGWVTITPMEVSSSGQFCPRPCHLWYAWARTCTVTTLLPKTWGHSTSLQDLGSTFTLALGTTKSTLTELTLQRCFLHARAESMPGCLSTGLQNSALFWGCPWENNDSTLSSCSTNL